MSAGKTYLKCKCPQCGAEVTYPDYAGGGASSCGQCGKTVLLPKAAIPPASPLPPAAPVKPLPKSAPAPVPAPRPSPVPAAQPKSVPAGVKRVDPAALRAASPGPAARGKSQWLRVCLWTVNLAVVIAVVVVVGSHLKQPREQSPEAASGKSPASPPTSPAPAQPSAAPAPVPSPAAKSPAAPASAAPPAPMPTPPPKGPKLIGDLKVTQIALDQPKGAKGSRLVYVTGLLKNDSDHQRLGVRVELDLLDAAGNKVGTATDYRQTVEPRATWQFRAIVTDRRATAAKLVGVKEDE